MRARHTKVVETIGTRYGTLVREGYVGYPATESNLYLVAPSGELSWFAERPMGNDAFASPIRYEGESKIKCGTWNGFDCEIDLDDGKLINAAFTK